MSDFAQIYVDPLKNSCGKKDFTLKAFIIGDLTKNNSTNF